MLELSVFSLSLNSIDILSGVIDLLFCILLWFDIGLLPSILFTLDPLVLTDFLLDIERGRGTGTLLLSDIYNKLNILCTTCIQTKLLLDVWPFFDNGDEV